MSKIERLIPNGIPRYVRVYDDGSRSYDRFTVVYTGKNARGSYLGMSERPTHPQGFGQHGETRHPWERVDRPTSSHLGKRIAWESLPEECQRVALATYRDIWGIKD
jgi:hypothetical protein